MAVESSKVPGSQDNVRLITPQAIQAAEIWQLPDGRVGRNIGSAANPDDSVAFDAGSIYVIPKEASVVFLDGQALYWDHSANVATYRKVEDRDFCLGRCIGGAAANDDEVSVAFNLDVPYDRDILRDPYTTTIVGTQALGGLGVYQRGGSLLFVLDATNEAQKLDALGVDGFDQDACPIVEGSFRVISDGAGANPDFSIGIANGTDATDADSITESLFLHLNGNSTTIYAESDDGTTEVAATDTTKTYTEGATVSSRVHFMFDLRDLTDIQCYINGVLVSAATAFKLNAATGPFYLLIHLEKTSSTDTYQVAVDKFMARFSEQ